MNTQLLATTSLFTAAMIVWIAAGVIVAGGVLRMILIDSLDCAAERKSPKPSPDDATAWGQKFEAMGQPHVTRKSHALGGIEGLHEEREAILEALRLVRLELHELRKQGPITAEWRTELNYALAEFQDYTQRRHDVDTKIKEWCR